MSKAMQKFALVLAAVMVLSMASFAAGELGVTGTAEFTLKYDGFTGDVLGSTYLKFNGVLKNAPVEVIYGNDAHNRFWKNIDFWNSYITGVDQKPYIWEPYMVKLKITGAYYKKGPRVTTHVGDFSYPLPMYVTGNFHKYQGMGVMISDYPIVDKVTVTPFFAWPKYGASHTLGGMPKYFWNMGALVNANNLVPDLTIKAYAMSHQQKEGTHIRYGADLGSKQAFSGVNASRGADQLILYTAGVTTGTNPWGKEALIGPDGKVLKNAANVDAVVPAGHYVISGHGAMATWVTENLTVGSTVDVVFGNPKTTRAEATYGVEAGYKLFGVNLASKFLLRTTYDATDLLDVKKDNQIVFTANADYTFVFDNNIKAKVSGGFRTIDQDFAPHARQTDARYNAIEAQRGQLGGNAGLNLTLPAKTSVDITGDYYNKKPTETSTTDRGTATVAVTNSYFFDVTAKASVTGTRTVTETPDEINVVNSVTTSGSLARNFRLPNRDQISATYSLSTSNVLAKPITWTNKLVASSNLTVPVLNKLYVEGTVQLVTADGETTPTFIGLLKHTLPNNVNLEAKFTKAGIQKLTWYAQATYSVSF
ncbi:MAG: hypothetical protein WCS44_00670 [Bacillota bacterium]